MSELKIIQYNVQKSKDKVMIPFFHQKIAREADVIAIQEPWENPFTKTSYKPRDFYLVYHTEGQDRPRVALYVNKKLDINRWETTYTLKDLYSIRITAGEMPVNIHYAYSQPLGSLNT
jgi:hypothetical protein